MTHLDGGVDGIADDARIGLPRAEPDCRDLGAGVQDEVAGHVLLCAYNPWSHKRKRSASGTDKWKPRAQTRG